MLHIIAAIAFGTLLAAAVLILFSMCMHSIYDSMKHDGSPLFSKFVMGAFGVMNLCTIVLWLVFVIYQFI